MTRRKHWLFLLTLLALTIEFSAFLSYQWLVHKRRLPIESAFVVPPSEIEDLKSIYDEQLGWKTPERAAPQSFGPAVASLFGDSFAEGSEVQDNETFAYFLGEKLKGDVKNFGTAGYGTDQALLRFQHEFPRKKTRLVILGLITENIIRTQSIYRGFLTGFRSLTKPRFHLKDGRLVLEKNFITKPEDLSLLTQENFIRDLAKGDGVFQAMRERYGRISFPFSQLYGKAAFWNDVSQGIARPEEPWYEAKVWADPEARALFFSLIREFVEGAKRQGATPVVLIFPMHNQVQRAREGGRSLHPAILMNYCAEQKYLCFNGLDVITVPEGRYMPAYHLSPRGNRALAQAFHEFLRTHNALQ